MTFALHPTLAADSQPLAETDTLVLRLIDDARFPWVIIVPKVAGSLDLHALPEDIYDDTVTLAKRLGAVMKEAFDADRINTAAIGNIVPQLHVHVVARRTDDAAWPRPIWGFGAMERMSPMQIAERSGLILDMLGPL